MLVELSALRPNPLRDFIIDPVDASRVDTLRDSIREDGFWGGIVCRRTKDGRIEVAAGQHRVQAALAAGIKTADVFVADNMDDADLVRIYSRENATQRGNTGTAQAGTIAAAIRLLAKGLATGDISLIGEISSKSTKSLECARGRMEGGEGIGQDLVLDLLDGIPGVTVKMVEQQLSNLKASGEYARIIGEVKSEIERENAEALKELERKEREHQAARAAAAKAEEERKAAAARAKAARDEEERRRVELARQKAEAEARLAKKRQEDMAKDLAKLDALKKTRDTITQAAETASQREVTFDHVGVSKYLQVPSHVAEFRRLVTSDGVRPYVQVAHQARLARELLEEAKTRNAEFTAAFMREHIITIARYGRTQQQRLNRDEQEARERQSLVSKYARLVEEFDTALRSVYSVGQQLIELERTWPKGLAKPISKRLVDDVDMASKIIANLKRSL